MLGFGKKKTKRKEIVAAQTGKLVRLDDVPDDVFAQKILGDGVAVLPHDDLVYDVARGKTTVAYYEKFNTFSLMFLRRKTKCA